MLLASDFRRIARESLNNRWGLAIGTGFVASLLGASLYGSGGGGSSANRVDRISEFSDFNNFGFFRSGIIHTIAPFLLSLGLIAIVWAIAIIIIGGATTLGYASFNLNIVDHKEAKFKDIFSQYHRLGAGFCMQFLRGLFIFLWSLLFIIPGIIAALSYSMTPYIMAENPELSASDAISYSKDMMNGHKWRLFCLQFSFIGWAILSAFTCGLGILVLTPYMEAATAAFYRDVSGTYHSNHQSYYYNGYQQNPFNGQNEFDQNQQNF